MIDWLGAAAACILPLCNIPLILKIRQRKSSKDVSLVWTFGVWICLLLMLPAGLRSADPIFRLFSITNVAMFSAVVVQVLRYR